MSTSTGDSSVQKILGRVYAERRDDEWDPVFACLREAITGDIVDCSEVAAVAFGLSPASQYEAFTERAAMIEGRVGRPGDLELGLLAQAAVFEAQTSDDGGELCAHASRVSFARSLPSDLSALALGTTARVVAEIRECCSEKWGVAMRTSNEPKQKTPATT